MNTVEEHRQIDRLVFDTYLEIILPTGGPTELTKASNSLKEYYGGFISQGKLLEDLGSGMENYKNFKTGYLADLRSRPQRPDVFKNHI